MRLLTALPVLPYKRWQNQPTTSTFTSLKHSRRPCAPSTAKQSIFFNIFKYARVVKQKVWNKAKNSDRDWGETLRFFFLSPHTPYGRVMLVRFARARLFTDFFTDFEKKTDCFAVYVHLAHECRHNLCCSPVCYKATSRNTSAFAGYVYLVTFIITNRLIRKI